MELLHQGSDQVNDSALSTRLRFLATGFGRLPPHALPPLDEHFPQVLPCFLLLLPDGALFTEDAVPIPVVIVADLRVMANWLPPRPTALAASAALVWPWMAAATSLTTPMPRSASVNSPRKT